MNPHNIQLKSVAVAPSDVPLQAPFANGFAILSQTPPFVLRRLTVCSSRPRAVERNGPHSSCSVYCPGWANTLLEQNDLAVIGSNADRWVSKVMPSYLIAVPGKAVIFGLDPEWMPLKGNLENVADSLGNLGHGLHIVIYGKCYGL